VADDTCSIDGCNRRIMARGLCNADYYKAKYHGTLDLISPNPSGPCGHCGQPIPEGRRWGAKYCSTDCGQKAVDAARHAALVQRRAAQSRSCGWCREPLTADKRFGTRFCSEPCDDNWHNEQKRLAMLRAKKAARRLCEVCGKPIPETRSSQAIYCSYECKKLGVRKVGPKAKQQQIDYNRHYLYGLTTEQYEALLASQDGKCAICRTDTWPGKGPHVDHDHNGSGMVRGILCHKCNLGLGKFDDRVDLLEAAIAYLKR
jgi:predicted nucleic acid-binding Zn ribbon protein